MDSDTQRGARHAPFDEESMFALLVKAIKRFLARLCQGFAPISSSPVRSSDASGPMSVNMSAASVLSGAQDEREETPAPRWPLFDTAHVSAWRGLRTIHYAIRLRRHWPYRPWNAVTRCARYCSKIFRIRTGYARRVRL